MEDYSPNPWGSPNDADVSADPTPYGGYSAHGGGSQSAHGQHHYGAMDSLAGLDAMWADMPPMASGLGDLEAFDIVAWTEQREAREEGISAVAVSLDGAASIGLVDQETGAVLSRVVSAASSSKTPLSEYYSCTNLSDGNPARRLHAAGVRAQINPPAHSAKERKFKNMEKLKLKVLEEEDATVALGPVAASASLLTTTATAPPSTMASTTAAPQNSPPDLLYYPVLNGSPWDPSKDVGAARAVFTEASRADPEVMYHDKTAPRLSKRQRFDSFSLANLREGRRAREAREKAEKKE